jgi:predicted DNA binding CopG/RHH family protein
VRRLTEGEIERGITALVPFADEWGLSLNPEDLQAMAVAVLIHTYSDETLEEIDDTERRWIKEDREAHHQMVAAMALEKRSRSVARMLTEEELTIIEGRAAAATPGPWKSLLRAAITPAETTSFEPAAWTTPAPTCISVTTRPTERASSLLRSRIRTSSLTPAMMCHDWSLRCAASASS